MPALALSVLGKAVRIRMAPSSSGMAKKMSQTRLSTASTQRPK